jgi:hypothetical protein
MIQIVLHRSLSLVIACCVVRQWKQGDIDHGWQDKSPDLRRGYVVGWIECFVPFTAWGCWRTGHKAQRVQCHERHRLRFCGR